jgi:hypothetical protein
MKVARSPAEQFVNFLIVTIAQQNKNDSHAHSIKSIVTLGTRTSEIPSHNNKPVSSELTKIN